jgi:3-oxoacyl-(acyl-carrier-protein) synthase
VTPLAVTGLGVCSSLGIGREAFVAALRSPNQRAPAKIASFDATAYPDARIAEVPDFDPTKYLGDNGLRTLDRLTKLSIVAARLALHDAGFKKDGQWVRSSPDRVGLVCSNAYGSLEAITELDRVATLEDARYINPAKFPNTVSNSAAGYVSIWEELRALNVSVSDGNCGGLDAVACGELFLDTGRADALLVGGAEAMSEPLFLAFRRLGSLAEDALLGEGAAMLVAEPASAVKARGARSMGELVGYGTAFVAPERATLIHASQAAMERAIADALDDANVDAKDVSVVASGVSGLRVFDDAELAAIERVIGDACVAAPKTLLGETLGAGGAMAMAAALAWLGDGGSTAPSPIVRGAVTRPIRTVLATSMGFYGNASAVVLRSGTN